MILKVSLSLSLSLYLTFNMDDEMEAEKNEIAREQRAAKFASRSWKGLPVEKRHLEIDGVAENTLCTHGQRRSNAISVCRE